MLCGLQMSSRRGDGAIVSATETGSESSKVQMAAAVCAATAMLTIIIVPQHRAKEERARALLSSLHSLPYSRHSQVCRVFRARLKKLARNHQIIIIIILVSIRRNLHHVHSPLSDLRRPSTFTPSAQEPQLTQTCPSTPNRTSALIT